MVSLETFPTVQYTLLAIGGLGVEVGKGVGGEEVWVEMELDPVVRILNLGVWFPSAGRFGYVIDRDWQA